MKNICHLIFSICCLTAGTLVLSACFAPLGYKSGDTTLSVGFGGGSAARPTLSPDDLRYELTFSGPGGRNFPEYLDGRGTVTVQVVPGRWNISVRAFEPADPEIILAISDTKTIDVNSGKNNVIEIIMRWVDELSIAMVWIDAGTFTMGSEDPQDTLGVPTDPEHLVTFAQGFFMGKYPVTQAQYLVVMRNNPSNFTGDLNRPVEMVTWFDVIEFCNKLSIIEGLTPVYTISNRTPAIGYPITSAVVIPNWNANGYRLPTEAQWEYACRAETTTGWSHNESLHNDYMWYNANSGGTTHPVGQKLANPWGLYDMHGNVYEWCWDWLGNTYYSTPGPWIDPIGPDSGFSRVSRGGTWNNPARNARSAIRNGGLPNSQFGNMGFRVVKP